MNRNLSTSFSVIAFLLVIASVLPGMADTMLPFTQKIGASNAAPGDYFGNRVAISGDWLISGSPLNDNKNGVDAGSAYFFKRENGVWSLSSQEVFGGIGSLPGDQFGWDVAIDGRWAVVGARHFDDGAVNSGALFVFYRNQFDFWELEGKLSVPNPGAGDELGQSVAISGNTIAAGSYLDDDDGSNSGTVSMFEFDGNTWAFKEKVRAPDGAAGNGFGVAVDIQGDSLIAGASRFDSPTTGVDVGKVYVFERVASGTWQFTQGLEPSDGRVGDYFGTTVALDGNTIVVGAALDDEPANESGAGFVFEKYSNGNWYEVAKLVGPVGLSSAVIGAASIAIKENTIVLSSYGEDYHFENTGSAFVFMRGVDGIWRLAAKMKADIYFQYTYFSTGVAMDGDTIVIGAQRYHYDGVDDSGAAFIYDLSELNINPDGPFQQGGGGSGGSGGNGWTVHGDEVYTGYAVGIGTDSPSQVLDVVSDSSAALRFRAEAGDAALYLDSSSGGSSNIRFKTNGTDAWVVSYVANQLRTSWKKNGRGMILTKETEFGGWENGFVRMGINTYSPQSALDVWGNIRAFSLSETSDERLKTNIRAIKDPVGMLKQINGVTYTRKLDEQPDMGVLAQDVEKVLPYLVKTDSEGYKSVDYTSLLPLLIEAIKLQDAKIEALTKRLEEQGK